MLKLRDLGADMPTRVPYTEEEILAKVIKGKKRGHIAGRGCFPERDGIEQRDKGGIGEGGNGEGGSENGDDDVGQ
ncbi:hypothetical protein Tco_0876193 [Tanacetum coccineum]|uniref:Uncharacterized protein n=1 Tax=Tanacetum coccineum TaxID=301880 RepID=A0ABQ5BUI2_9ASTR